MITKKVKVRLLIVLLSGLFVIGGLIFYAFAWTWNKTDIEFKIHINEDVILQTVYGESPTFAIWIENQETRNVETVFVTSRVGENDWEGKTEVPSALPKWSSINSEERRADQDREGLLEEVDAITGATPQPGYFVSKARVNPGSKWICWIEVNLAGNYNEHYQYFDEVTKKIDEFGTGQPAIVYKAYIEAVIGNTIVPEVVGMSTLNKEGEIIQPLEGITTALDVFDEITIAVRRPNPKILRNH